MKVGLEALELLKAKRYRRGDHREAYMPAARHEISTGAEQDWLLSAASAGDCVAMEQLAEHLLAARDSVPPHAEACRWLWRAVQEESVSAAYTLAVWLLDDASICDLEEGGRLLQRAAKPGFLPAVRELGIRLMTGAGFACDGEAGKRWLTQAAEAGDRISMVLLGRYFMAGVYLPLSSEEGKRWLVRAGAITESDQSALGMALYQACLRATTPAIRERFALEAASLLLEGFRRGELNAAANLGYMVRRAEVPSDGYPSLDDLLQAGLAQSNSFAIVNESLRRAAGVSCVQDWRAADRMITSLAGSAGVLDWWLPRAQAADAEGHLVIGWLVRHGLTADPDGLVLAQRFEQARAGGWSIPDWMTN